MPRQSSIHSLLKAIRDAQSRPATDLDGDHLATVADMAAFNYLTSERAGTRRLMANTLNRLLYETGLAGFITPLVAVRRSERRGLVVRDRRGFGVYAAFRSDPLDGRNPS